MALSRKVYSTWLGRVSYADGLALQVRVTTRLCTRAKVCSAQIGKFA